MQGHYMLHPEYGEEVHWPRAAQEEHKENTLEEIRETFNGGKTAHRIAMAADPEWWANQTEPLYHVTNWELLPTIKKQGIIPWDAPIKDAPGSSWEGMPQEPQSGHVYLCTAEGIEGVMNHDKNQGDDVGIVEIDPSQLDPSRMSADEDMANSSEVWTPEEVVNSHAQGSIAYQGGIPPEAIVGISRPEDMGYEFVQMGDDWSGRWASPEAQWEAHDPQDGSTDFTYMGKTAAGELETSYHLTDDPNFQFDPEFSPQVNQNSLLAGGNLKPGMYMTKTPLEWARHKGYIRPYVAEIEHPPLPDQTNSWGYGLGETYLLAEQYPQAKVKRVIPLDDFAKEDVMWKDKPSFTENARSEYEYQQRSWAQRQRRYVSDPGEWEAICDEAGLDDDDPMRESDQYGTTGLERTAKTAGKTRTQLLNDAQAHEGQYGPDTSEVVKQLVDGWTVRRPTTLADIEREGTLMGNCVADGDYNREVSLPRYTEDGISQSSSLDWGNPEHWNIPSDNYYHSLRDPDNLPHATWTHTDNIEGRHGSHPKEEHWSRLREFMPQMPEWEPMTRCDYCGEMVNENSIHPYGEEEYCERCAEPPARRYATQRPTLSHTSNEFDLSLWMDRPEPRQEGQSVLPMGTSNLACNVDGCFAPKSNAWSSNACPECEAYMDTTGEWPETKRQVKEWSQRTAKTSEFDPSLWTDEPKPSQQIDGQQEIKPCETRGCSNMAHPMRWGEARCQECRQKWVSDGVWEPVIPEGGEVDERYLDPAPHLSHSSPLSPTQGNTPKGLQPMEGDTDSGLQPTVPPASPHAHAHKGLTNPYQSASAYLSAVADLGFVVKSEFDPSVWGEKKKNPDQHQGRLVPCSTRGCPDLVEYAPGSMNHKCIDCAHYMRSGLASLNGFHRDDVDAYLAPR